MDANKKPRRPGFDRAACMARQRIADARSSPPPTPPARRPRSLRERKPPPRAENDDDPTAALSARAAVGTRQHSRAKGEPDGEHGGRML